MPNIDIKQNLIKKFTQPLPDFYQRRIVFWKDSEKEFESFVDELNIDNVKIAKLNNSNSFYVKKLLLMDEPRTNFLIYDTSSYDDPRDCWMWDVELYSESFRADYLSTLMEEMDIAQSPSLRSTVREYTKFFDNKERKATYKSLCTSTDDVRTLHMGIIATLVNAKSLYMHDILLQIIKSGFDKNNNNPYQNIVKFGNEEIFWKAVSNYTGYQGDDLKELVKSILITALAQTMSVEEIEKVYSEYLNAEKIGHCYDIVNEWYGSSDEMFVKRIIIDIGRNYILFPYC